MFCFFPANLMSSTFTNKNSSFSRLTNKHSQFGTFSQYNVSTELPQIAVPIIVLPKDVRTNFVQEERLDLPCWTMIFSYLRLVDAPKYLDTLTLEF